MKITTVKFNATRNIGTRVVAVSDDCHRVVELWDFNADDATNHLRAAQAIAASAQLTRTGDYFSEFEAN